MIALSTSYFTSRNAEVPGETIARETQDLGFRALEFEYRLSEAQWKGLERSLARGQIAVPSVHHPFPRDGRTPPATAHLTRLRFSSLDPEERRAAVRLCADTLLRAADLGAGVVVVHLGQVVVESDLDPSELERMARSGLRDTEEYAALRERVATARAARVAAHRDAVLSSLDPLCSAAIKAGVALGLENRYHPVEIPDREDLLAIFRELDGAPLGYWHDTGHGASQETLGFVSSQAELLAEFQQRLLGVHLHDARGLDDHLAPGEGDLDFAVLSPLVSAHAALVLEIHPPTTPEAVHRGREVLRDAGFNVEQAQAGEDAAEPEYGGEDSLPSGA